MSNKRQRKADRKRRIEQLAHPDRCFCDHEPNEETEMAFASALLKCSTETDKEAVGEQFKEYLYPGELVESIDEGYIGIWRCRTCGKLFQTGPPGIAGDKDETEEL